jgi:3-dehydroquinate synthase
MSDTRLITVELGERSYPIVIGNGLLGGGFDLSPHVNGPDCLVVTNETVEPLYLEALLADLPGKQVRAISLPDGEAYKTLETVEDILDTLVEGGANRDTTLVALGGGVVGDLLHARCRLHTGADHVTRAGRQFGRRQDRR